MKGSVLFFLMFLSFSVPEVRACGELTIVPKDSLIDFTSHSQSVKKIDINRTDKNQSCQWFVGFDQGLEGTYTRKLINGSSSIHYNVYSNNGHSSILRDVPDITFSSHALIGSFPSNGPKKKKVTYYPGIGALTGAELPGLYEDTLNLKLYRGEISGPSTLEDTASVTYRYIVSSTASLSLVNPGAPHDPNSGSRNVNFGLLTTGEIHNFDMTVMSNSDYEIFFSSQNDGKMKHVTIINYVDYSLTINGSLIDLSGSSSSPVLAASGISPTPAGGDRFSGQFIIDSITNQVAGTYQDVITVTLSTNL